MSKGPDPHRKALGKGLSSLLPTRPSPPAQPETSQANAPSPEPMRVPIELIDPNPLQPRTVFQAERLRELSDSIRSNGIIQPLIVRRKGDRYELVAGERRWRAARMAGLDTIPVVVQDIANEKMLEVSLIENIQREDLNPIELAQAYDRLARELHISHEEIGKRTGKDRATITNMLRLLRLPPEVQLLLAEHRLSMGHARAILGLGTADLQRQVAEKASAQGLSVRQVERLVQKINEPRDPAKTAPDSPQDPNVKAAIEELERFLGTKVRIIEKSDNRGRIEIDYFSQEDLARLYELITSGKAE